tara:strand:- start:8776 stop:9015 length:240 start_codon:yes stop_codon:yes gene_type:complete
VAGLPLFIIPHGHKELKFSHLVIPHPENSLDYSWKSPNLMTLPHAIPTTGPDAEAKDTDFSEVNLLKEEIAKWRKDNND